MAEGPSLYVYGDESGTMPLEDGAGAFTCGVVVGRDPLQGADPRRSAQKLLVTLTQSGAYPFVAYIQPRPGYAERLQQKLTLLNDTAQVTREGSGRNRDFVPVKGVDPRNWVWSLAMSEAIGLALFKGVFEQPVTALTLVLNAKSFAPESRRLFEREVSRAPARIRTELTAARHMAPELVDRLLTNLLCDATRISVDWRSNRDRGEHAAGLILADRLAGQVWRDLIGTHPTGLLDSLRATRDAWGPCVMDVTDALLKPLSPEVVRRWAKVGS